LPSLDSTGLEQIVTVAGVNAMGENELSPGVEMEWNNFILLLIVFR
jgi:hypothetical protein